MLVLDVSGSMKGKPLTELKKAANAFCDYILKADEGNRIAIVAYSSKAKILHNFTNDYQALSAIIDNLKSGGSTNMYDGLDCADKLLSSNSINLSAAKQIFLMSDGLPNAGSASNAGPYANTNYSGYRYANAVFNKANDMKNKGYNMLTLGFFHARTKSEFIPRRLRFAMGFMETDLPCEGFRNRMTVVNNPDDLMSRFIIAAEMLNGIPSMCGEQAETQSESIAVSSDLSASNVTVTDKLPQTGILYLPIPVCGGISALAVIIGLVLNRKRKVKKKPKIFVLFLAVLPLLLSVGVAAYNYWDDDRANTAAVWTTLTLYEQIEEYQENGGENDSQLIEIDGEFYTGILSIPSLDLELPINNELNDERLKASPCRYSGDISSSMVIAAHNYKTHFGEILNLIYGDTLIITDAAGNKHHYTVELLTVLNESDVDAMINTLYDLTLFTCTSDRKNRITIRCTETTGAESSPYPLFPEYDVKQGQADGNVKLMQKYLNEIRSIQPDIPALIEDGSFGSATKKAVQTFQNLYGLTADGIIGQNTWNKIVTLYISLQ